MTKRKDQTGGKPQTAKPSTISLLDDPLYGMTIQAKAYLLPIIPRIIALSPGASELFESSDEKTLNTTRSHFYKWTMKKGARSQFKTYKESPTLLRIVRLGITPMRVVQEQPFTPSQVFIEERLKTCQGLKEASEIVFSANERGEISDSMVQDIIELWREENEACPIKEDKELTNLVEEAVKRSSDLFERIEEEGKEKGEEKEED